MKRLLNTVLAVLLSLFDRPPLPRIVKHNLHPFMKRCYGRVVAGGAGSFSPIMAVGAAVVMLAIFAGAALALSHGHAPDPLLITAALAGTTEAVAVKQREELHEKQRTLTDVLELAGRDMDFSKAGVLEKLGAADADDAVKKFQLLNRETEVIGQEIMREELKASARKVQEREEALRRPADDVQHPSSILERKKSWGQRYIESKAFRQSRESKTDVPFEIEGVDVKTLFETSAGFAPESVRSGLLVPAATRPIQVIDLIPSFPISQPSFVYMEETTRTHAAAEKAEGVAAPESTFVWTQKSSPVVKIPDSIPVTDEQLEDEQQVRSLLEQRLAFGLRQRADGQVLVGNGTPPNLRGINNVVGVQTQAKGTDSAIVAFLRALTKVRFTGRANPTGAVFHPNDWLDIVLTQDAEGRFLFGNPFQGAGPNALFGIPVAQSDAQTEHTGLVVDFANFTRIDDRRGVVIQTGYVGTQFTEGKVTLRADLRMAFTLTRPAAACQITGI